MLSAGMRWLLVTLTSSIRLKSNFSGICCGFKKAKDRASHTVRPITTPPVGRFYYTADLIWTDWRQKGVENGVVLGSGAKGSDPFAPDPATTPFSYPAFLH